MIVLEITGVTAAGTPTTFYISDGTFTPNSPIAFRPDLLDPGSIGLHLYADGQTGGVTSLEIGELVIANADGAYDDWLSTYGFDGQVVKIRRHRESQSVIWPLTFPIAFTGAVESIEAGFKTIVVRIRDRRHTLEKQVLSSVYAGSNVLPAGLEGTAADIKGTPKPRVYGYVSNAAAVCVNTSTLTYQVSDGGATISAVYDAGVPLSFVGNYSTSAAMQAATPPTVGGFYTCTNEGYFRLRSTPSGQVTCDASAGTGTNTAAGSVIAAMAADAGISLLVDPANVAAMNAVNPSYTGIYITDATTFREAFDEILVSVGGYVFFDATGMLRMGILTPPSGAPVLTIQDYDIVGAPERRPARDVSVPAWQVTVEHSKVYTVQTSGLAAATTDARRAYLARERRSVVAEDATVKLQHPLATALTVQTLLANPTTTTAATDAATEAARLLAMHKVNRDAFDIPIRIDLVTEFGLKFMDVIQVVYPRFGMNAGRSFRLIGVRFELAKKLAILTLWG